MNNQFQLDSYMNDLEQLVNMDSGSTDAEGVAQVANWLKVRFESMGWFVSSHIFSPEAGPCVELANTTADSYDVLLMGHMDTVFSKGTAKERPFTIKGDRAYGPGVIDMKAGLLLGYYALRRLASDGRLAGLSVCFALNSEEETGSKYSRKWLEQLAAKSRTVLVLEPARANGALVLRRKGLGRYDVVFQGIAAHAGVEPEKGASAIEELAHWIVNLHRLTDFSVGTTINVGVVQGGTAANVVAAQASAEVDFRVADPAELTKIETAIQKLVHEPHVNGVKAVVTGGVTRPVMNPTPETEQLCRQIEEIGQRLGITIQWASTGGGSDGNFAAALGIPTIDGLGPVGGGTHSLNEYLEINSVEERLHLLEEILVKLKGAEL